MVVLIVCVCVAAAACEAALTVSTPDAGKPWPPRKLWLASELLNCPPTDVEEMSAELRSAFAVPE